MDEISDPLTSLDWAEHLFDLAAVIILVLDVNGRVKRINPKGCELLEHRSEDITGKDWFDHFLPADIREETRCVFHRLMRREEDIQNQHANPVLAASGTIRYIEWHNALLEDSDGQIRGIVSSGLDVTERHEARQALQESEERYRSLFEHMLHGYAYCRMLFEDGIPVDFVYLDVNPAFEEQTGLRDVVGKRISEIIPDVRKDNPGLFESCGRTALTGKPERFETYFSALGRWYSVSVYSHATEHLVVVFNNITARKNAEAALRDSEAYYKALFHGNSDAIFLNALLPSGEPGHFLKVNEAACRRLGYTEAELLEMSPRDIDADGMDEQRASAISTLLTGGEAVFEMEHVTRDGRVTPVEISANLIEVQGHPMVLSIARDISELKQSLQLLRSHKEHIQTLLDSMAEGMFGVDMRGNCTFVNQACLKLLGYKRPEDLLGRHLHELIHHHHAVGTPYPTETCRVYLAHNENRDCHVDDEVFWRSDGSPLPVEYWSYPVRGDGRIVGSVLTFQDISERRQADEKLLSARKLLENVINTVPHNVFWKDRQSRYLGCNMVFARNAGLDGPDDIIGKDDYALAWRAFADQYRRDDVEVMTTGIPKLHIIEPINMADGEHRWLDTSKMPLRDSQGEIIGMLGVFQDVTERLRAEEKLSQAAKVFESTMEGVVITDAGGNIVAVNPAFTEITGFSEEEALGKNPRIRQSGRHDESFYNAMWSSILQNGSWRGEIWNRRKTGEIYPEWLTISSVNDETGNIINYVGVFADISQLKHSEAELDYLAHHDPLTDLPNRLLLSARLDHAIQHARREGISVAVLFLDLDRFKTVNDSLGHPAGDKLLRIVASLLSANVRNADTVARVGGDEFVIVLEGISDTRYVSDVAKKIQIALNKHFDLDGQDVFVSVSIGISIYPEDGRDATTLLKNADAAMYQSKEEGRNTIRLYNAELTQKAQERLILETELRRAIEKQEFLLHFQPQVDVASGAIIGAEALVRWQHPESGLIPPNRFIHLAEETGLILPLGEWVLSTACAQLQTWLAEGIPPVTLAVNLSPRQFHHQDLVKQLRTILDATGIPPTLLELEITESAIMEQGEKVTITLHSLMDLGVKVAIDDFGTGYSSLACLRRFPINTLKIDQSFMCDIPHDTSAKEIVVTIIAMAHNLRMKVLAEGVETQEQLAFLQRHGCDAYQGFLTSRPVTAETFLDVLRANVKTRQIAALTKIR